jgi:hypothetical protein
MLEPDAAPVADTSGIFPNEFNAGGIERLDDLGQSFDNTPNIAFTGFHPLDGRQRDIGKLSKLALVDAEQSPGGSHLGCSDHARSISAAMM